VYGARVRPQVRAAQQKQERRKGGETQRVAENAAVAAKLQRAALAAERAHERARGVAAAQAAQLPAVRAQRGARLGQAAGEAAEAAAEQLCRLRGRLSPAEFERSRRMLETALANALRKEGAKYRTLKTGNAQFAAVLKPHPEVAALLAQAGFVEHLPPSPPPPSGLAAAASELARVGARACPRGAWIHVQEP
jgi:hypothetical protein